MCDPSAPAPDSSHSVPVVSVYLQGPQTLLGNTVGNGHRPHQPRPATFTGDPPTHTPRQRPQDSCSSCKVNTAQSSRDNEGGRALPALLQTPELSRKPELCFWGWKSVA